MFTAAAKLTPATLLSVGGMSLWARQNSQIFYDDVNQKEMGGQGLRLSVGEVATEYIMQAACVL